MHAKTWLLPHLDPIIVSVGPLALRWYGLMYLLGFCFAWWQAKRQARQPNSGWQVKEVETLLHACFLGLFFGGRLGYTLLYQYPTFVADPLSILRIWEGGMSFHGGLLGVILALRWFARLTQRPFLSVADFIAPWVPIGLGLGRIGNFINGELWGRVTGVPWGVIFPQAGPLPRHPSQLYEAILEGVLLFLLLQHFRHPSRPTGTLSAFFLCGYGFLRFIVEYYREPDPQFATVAGILTMGQQLSLPMILSGLVLLILAYRRSA
jgi:phosphatidylglycerol---prolipoprotein diacylglyceryl transferase